MMSRIRRTLNSQHWLLFLLVLILAIALLTMLIILNRAPQAIEYSQRFPLATPAEVCPGETITFPVNIVIKWGESSARITEGWCRVFDGICPRSFQAEPYYVNFIEPYSVSTRATRTIPSDLPSGAWQFRHCNEAHSSGLIAVTCYQVDVSVKDCE